MGNPGPQHALTRHNVGFRIVELLASRGGVGLTESGWSSRVGLVRLAGLTTALIQPLTYMNRSGQALGSLLRDHPGIDLTQNMLVVYDDLDLPFGQIRLRARGGSGGHRGLASIIETVGSGTFPRLRFGIGRPHSDGQTIRDFVLGSFEGEELEALPDALGHAGDALECFMELGIEAAMDRFNAVDR